MQGRLANIFNIEASITSFRNSQFLIYGLAAGISRAGGLLAIPVAAHALSLNEIGIYAMGVALVQILAQFLSLGGGAAVAREGATNTLLARSLAMQFSLAALILAALISVAIVVLPVPNYWIFFIFLAAHEAIQQLLQLVLRAENRPHVFLIFAIIKTFFWVGFASLVLNFGANKVWVLDTWLVLQLGAYSVVTLAFVWNRPSKKFGKLPIAPGVRWAYQHLPYCLPLILHGLAQWALNSSDRFVVGWMIGNEKLAIYSLAYTVASVMSVLLSGLGLYLPHEIMKNMDEWSSAPMRYKFIKKFVWGYVVVAVFLFAVFLLDYKYIGALKYYHYSMPLIIGIVVASLLYLSIYQIYVCFLFATKATMRLSKITLLVSLLYFLVLVPLVYMLENIGAALATLLAYIYYMSAVRKAAVSTCALDSSLLPSETRVTFYGAVFCLLLGLSLSSLLMMQS